MALAFSNLTAFYNHGFDAVIDVRSPAEFTADHIPGAINLPSLSNVERAEVGTIYKQVSPFKARKVGASLVLSNVAKHIAGPLQNYDGAWRPLIYCWRGGQRSGVFTTLLKEVGWRAEVVEGGYQTYRRLVQKSLYDVPISHRFILLDGYTGTAKTAALNQLPELGVQSIDLEGLAGHRGSLLGEMPGGQPEQRMFESRLALALHKCDPLQPVVLEAESSKIGRLILPPSLWKAMLNAPRIHIEAPLDTRVEYISDAYRDILLDPETVTHRLAPLRRLRSHAVVDQWRDLQRAGDLQGLARSLIEEHYDPAYATARKKRDHVTLAQVESERLDPSGINKTAETVAEIVRSL